MESYKIKSILVPIDFSKLSKSALKMAAAICCRQQAKLHLLFVADYNSSIDDINYALNELKNIEEITFKHIQIEINSFVAKGNPAEEICNLAHKEGISLIVMGAHSLLSIQEYLGSTTYSVIKNALCPVLVMPEDHDQKHIKKIIYPIRYDQKVFEKYNYISPIIEQNNSELIIAGLANKDEPHQLKEVVFYIELLKNMCMEEKIRYSTHLFPSDIALQSNSFAIKIIDTADHQEADLIVISSHLDYDSKENIVGPFALYILRNSKCPVLCISPLLNK